MIVGGSLLAVLTTLNYYALNEEHGDISAPLGIGYFMTDPLKWNKQKTLGHSCIEYICATLTADKYRNII